MTGFNLEDSASHNLTAQEIVIRMIDYDEPGSDLYYQTVLDSRVTRLQQEHERAAEQGNVPGELQLALDHARRDYRDALRLNRELYTAAEEIAQGLKHPTLVLISRWFINDGIVAFTIYSAYHWAKAHGKEVPEWAPPVATLEEATEQAGSPARALTPDRGWADVSIQLLTNNRIRYRIGTGRWVIKPLTQTLFVDKRKSGVSTNQAYQDLIWLAGGAYFGAGRVASGADKAKRDKLCKALVDLTGIGGSPFMGRSQREGYKPHFTVEDKSEESDQSTTWDLPHEEYDPHRGYDVNDEDDNDNDDEDEDSW